MANHPDLNKWQNRIAVLRARNNGESAPADVKKEAADRIKQLETAVTKFNGCYDANYSKIWQQLEEQAGATKPILDNLIERFDRVDGAADYKKFVKMAVDFVDKDISTKEEALPGKRAAIAKAEKERDELKQKLMDVENKLKGVETLCDEVGKWGADVAKARKDAEAIVPEQHPIEAWTAIYKMESALAKLEEKLKGSNPATDNATTLNTEMTNLEKLLKEYRAKGQEVDNLKADLKAAEAELANDRLARAEHILLKYEELSTAPPPNTTTGGTTTGATQPYPTQTGATQPYPAQTGAAQTDEAQPGEAQVGAVQTGAAPHPAAETKTGSDVP